MHFLVSYFLCFFLPPFSFIKNLCLFCFTVRIHCMRVLFFVFSFCSFKKTQSNWIINQFGINNKYIIFLDKFLNVNMTIDPNMIEVNEITDYWSFLMSVCSEYWGGYKKEISNTILFYRLTGEIHGWLVWSSCTSWQRPQLWWHGIIQIFKYFYS